MMQDNFEQFKRYIDRRTKGYWCFFNVAVIRRKKDGHDVHGCNLNRTVKQYFIVSKEHLEEYESEIKALCETFYARAYIDPCPRAYLDFSKELLYELSDRIRCSDLFKLERVTFRAAAKCPRIEKYWIVDIDDMTQVNKVVQWFADHNLADHLCTTVKTNTGEHLIMKPFDLRDFIQEFPDVEVKRNNMTCLYVPKVLSNE